MADHDTSLPSAAVRYAVGDHDRRPWGEWKVVDIGNRFAIKRITVRPGARLSLQYHHHRAEHWLIVQGQGRVTCGENLIDVAAMHAVDIPQGALHRVENTGDIDLVVIEIQHGDLLDEADIVRVEDDYRRVP